MNNSNISVEDVPLNGFHQRLTVSVGGASLMDGYILSIIGIALVQMTANLQLTNFWQGMIATSALLGIFAGGLFSGCSPISLVAEKLYLWHLLFF